MLGNKKVDPMCSPQSRFVRLITSPRGSTAPESLALVINRTPELLGNESCGSQDEDDDGEVPMG